MSYPIKTERGDKDTAKAHKMLGKYKDGGAVKDTGTNIHISINAAPKPGGPGGTPDPALASALAQAAAPPPPPMGGMPPPDMGMGAPPMGMGPGAGPGPIAMRRGGRVKNSPSGGETSAASKTRGDKFRPDHKTDTVPARKSHGGGVLQLHNKDGGSGSGPGRLKKTSNEARSD